MKHILLLILTLIITYNLSGISDKGKIISVYTTETTYHNGKDIDRFLISKIDSIYLLQDELEKELENVNRYDTSIYEEIDSLRRVFLYNDNEIKNLIAVWNSKYDYKWSEPSIQDINEFDENGEPKRVREYSVYKVNKKRIKPNAIVDGGDSSVIIVNTIDSILKYEIYDVKKRNVFLQGDLELINNSFSFPTRKIIDTLYSIYNKEIDSDFRKHNIEVEFLVKGNDKVIDKFRFIHTIEITPTNYYNYSYTEGEGEVNTEEDSLLFLKDIDSIHSVIKSNQKKNNYAVFKIVLNKSHSRTPVVIENATRIRDSIKALIDIFDLKTNVSLDLLRTLLTSLEKADSVLDSELIAFGSGFPEEIYYSNYLLKTSDSWSFERDQLVSFEIYGKGADLQFEIFEEGNSKPFANYGIKDLNGGSIIHADDFHKQIRDYLYREGSSFLDQYSTILIFQVKSKGKVLSRFTCTFNATIG